MGWRPMIRIHLLLSSVLASLLLAVPSLGQKDVSPRVQQLAAFNDGAPFQALRAETGGQWHVDWNPATGTPRSLWGSGLPLADWRENSLEEARRHALALLQQRRELLGLGVSDFVETIGARMGRTWSFTFEQRFRGLRAVGGRVDVRVHMVGRVPMMGSTAWPLPADFGVTPTLSAEVATAIAWQRLGEAPAQAQQLAELPAPELVIYGDAHADAPQTPKLAWQITVANVAADGSGPIGRSYVDAHTGAVLRFVSDKHSCTEACTHGALAAAAAPMAAPAPAALPVATTVTVMGWTRGGIGALDTLVNVPMAGLQLTVPGIGGVTTDGNGQFTVNLTAPVSIAVASLDGRHHQPIAGAGWPAQSFVVNPGVASTIQLLTSGAGADNVAHTNAARWIDRANEWCRGMFGPSSQMNTLSGIGVNVNVNLTCNAYYTSSPFSLNFYVTGGGCYNSCYSSVILHEWGHAIDSTYGGASQIDGLSEAWGDIASMYVLDAADVGTGFTGSGTLLRTGNNGAQFPAGGTVHTQGQTFMGFAWKLRNRLATTLGSRALAIALTEDIVMGSIVADANDQAGAVQQVFLADDDDGNLANGTPHMQDLIWACQQHSLPHPGPSAGILNDECTYPVLLQNGVTGPLSTVGATSSMVNWGCSAAGNDLWYYYQASDAGTLTVETCGLSAFDTVLQVFSGTCGALTSLACNDDACGFQSRVSLNVTPGRYLIRVGGYANQTGTFSLNVQGPSAWDASSVAYGTACGQATRSFYELFAPNGFDLNGAGLVMTPVGDHYVVDYGGNWIIPPSNATLLPLANDGQITIGLPNVMSFPGSFTTSLTVCANGFVSADIGNGTSPTPDAAAWLASPLARWGTWFDFDPSAAGSGKVKAHVAGSVQCITWDGVYRAGTTQAYRWQLQFDTATGEVAMQWQVMPTPPALLVGFAAGAPSSPSGSRDLSAATPFATAEYELTALSLSSNLPLLGTTLTIATTDIPLPSQFGLLALGLQRLEPGVPLDGLGMTGCAAYTSLDVIHAIWPGNGYADWSMPIPLDVDLVGFRMHAQSVVMAPGVNAASLAASNGLRLQIGW